MGESSADKEYARKILLKIGYFPLINGYKEVFKESINDQFQIGTTFEDIYELYSFDNDLRNIFLKYILVAERNIKSSLSYHFCKEYGDLQSDYLDVNNYDYTGKKKNIINGQYFNSLTEEIKKHKVEKLPYRNIV